MTKFQKWANNVRVDNEPNFKFQKEADRGQNIKKVDLGQKIKRKLAHLGGYQIGTPNLIDKSQILHIWVSLICIS
jgi:hypothetical protein